LTFAIFVFVPAVGAFVHVDLTPEEYLRLPASVYTPPRTLDAPRSSALHSIPLDDLEGLVAFQVFIPRPACSTSGPFDRSVCCTGPQSW
jgi:hypothetical protein